MVSISAGPAARRAGASSPTTATLGQLVGHIGPPILTLHAAPRGLDVPVEGVSIHDAVDPVPCAPADLVVAVGITPGGIPDGMLRDLATQGASAVLVKRTGDIDPAAVRSAEGCGMALLSVPSGSSWTRVLTWLRAAVSDQALHAPATEAVGGLVAGDLFALANAVAALMDAPVTIEDPQLRVLAFSRRQEDADPVRLATILGQQTPEPYRGRMRDQGVLRRLYAGARPLYLPGVPPDVHPRLAAPVRAGGEILGSIWVAVQGRPPRGRIDALHDAATAAALHLLQHRLAGDARREMRSALVTTALGGGAAAEDAARRLGLDGPCQVVAAGVVAAPERDPMRALGQVLDSLQLHLSALHRNAHSARIGATVYAVVPTPNGDQESPAVRRSLRTYVQRMGRQLGDSVRIGVGEPAAGVLHLPRARDQADRALRVLLLNPEAEPVAGLDDTWLDSLLLHLDRSGPLEMEAARRGLRRLEDHDERGGTNFTTTVESWLRHGGDTAAVAGELALHDNTIRFRMRALRRLGLVDLDDAAERLGLQIALRHARLVGRIGAPKAGPTSP